jgi:DNA-binding transcriptional ArsR family regulator
MKDIDKVFKALADPNRRLLVDRLHKRPGQTLTQLCQGLDMARQSVTQHLGLLEEANLISIRWQGREKLHYFNPVPIHDIYVRWIRKFEVAHLEALNNLKSKLEDHDHEHREARLHNLYRHDAGQVVEGPDRGGAHPPVLETRKRV